MSTVFKGLRRITNAGNPPTSWRWTRTGGQAWSVIQFGPFDDVYRAGAALSADADVIDIQKQGESNTYLLTASYNGDEVQEIHEVNGSHLMQSLVENTFIRESLSDAGILDPTKAIADMIRCANDFKTGRWTGASAYLEAKREMELAVGAISTYIEGLFKEMLTTSDQFLNSAYVYRHTQLYAERIWAALSGENTFANANRIHTEAQVRTAEVVPPGFYLPPGEWLKASCDTSLTVGQKRGVKVEYLWADAWSRYRYREAA